MARIDNLTNFVNDIATSIKSKKGYPSTQKILARDFDTEISSIDGGSSNVKLFETIEEMMSSSVSDGTIGVVFDDNFVGLYKKDNTHWIHLGIPVSEIDIMNVLNDVDGIDDEYEGMGATSEQIGTVLDTIYGRVI